MIDCAANSFELNPRRTLMIGDRLETDILFGQAGNMNTLLVLSGVCDEETARTSEIKADHIFPSLHELIVPDV